MAYVLHPLQGAIFSALLVYVGYRDIRTREIPNLISACIFLTTFIDFPKFRPVNSLLGLFLLPLPFLYHFITKKVGGGDVKLIAACGFLLGVGRGLAAIFISLPLAILFQLVYIKAKHLKLSVSFPLAPYLSFGFLLVYWIF